MKPTGPTWRRHRPGEGPKPVVVIGICEACDLMTQRPRPEPDSRAFTREVLWVIDEAGTYLLAHPPRPDFDPDTAGPAIESARRTSKKRWTPPTDRSTRVLDRSEVVTAVCPKHGTIATPEPLDPDTIQPGRTRWVHLRSAPTR